MIAFIVQYWLEVLFGLIAAGAGFAAKKFYDLYRKEQEHQEEDKADELKENLSNELLEVLNEHKQHSKERVINLQREVDSVRAEMDILKGGILGIQGRSFKQDCRKLLESDHVISLEEWDAISIDHDIYNSLGGNHDGDRLYEDVEAKYRNGLK